MCVSCTPYCQMTHEVPNVKTNDEVWPATEALLQFCLPHFLAAATVHIQSNGGSHTCPLVPLHQALSQEVQARSFMGCKNTDEYLAHFIAN